MSDKKPQKGSYMRYSGMAFELIGIMIIVVFVGRKLDAYFETPKPFLTLALLIFFLVAYFVKIYYTLTNENK